MVAALLCAIVAGASASTVAVNVSKHAVTSNETVTSTVTNMLNGTHYSQKITFYQHVKPGSPSEIATKTAWPFMLKDDIFIMSTANTTDNNVYIEHQWPPERGGGNESLWFNGTSTNGAWTRSHHFETNQTGTYSTAWHSTPLSGAEIVTSTFWINGTKISGPNNFTQTITAWVRNPTLVELEYYENDAFATRDSFTIDWAGPIPTTIPTQSGGGGSGSESYGGSSSSGAITTVTTSGAGTTGSAATTTAGTGGTATINGTPAGTATAQATGNATATTTAPPAGSPFAFAALGAIGVAALLLAGRLRR